MDNDQLFFSGAAAGRRLSKGHRAVVEYINAHYEKAAYMTAASLAKNAGVSESTVVRFAGAMGFEGYSQLQKALQENMRSRLTSVQRAQIASGLEEEDVLENVLRADIQNIRRTIESIDVQGFHAAIDNLFSAKRVYVLGVRSSAPIAQFLGYYLCFLVENVTVVTPGISDVIEQIVRVGEGDLLLGISFPRYSARAVEAMRYAKRRGAVVIALTDRAASPVGEAADICLTAHSDMASFADSLVAPLSVVNALVVGMSLRSKSELNDYLTALEGLWSDIRVYERPENGR